MSDTAIQVDHVWKKFRKGEYHDSLRDLIPALTKRLLGRGPKAGALEEEEFWALHDVSFEVKRGHSLGIIGPNGAGKSTMLKLLSRIIKPNKGEYKVNGRVSALIEVGAGFHGDLTGRENIYLNGTILGMPRKVLRSKEQQIIDFAGIEEFIDTPVKRYSSGMKARLGFAVAAHMEPDVLLVDEVLSVGDARFRQKCIRHMRKLIDSDVTVVFISHLLEQVRALCPNTVVLDHGKAVYNGPTDQAIRKYLDLLGNDDTADDTPYHDAEIRNIRMCNQEGHEVLEWTGREPAVIDCEVVLKKPAQDAVLLVNVSSIAGVYLGTANSARQGLSLPQQPGSYKVRFTLSPMLLADGEYNLVVCVHDAATNSRLWMPRHPRTISIRGGGGAGAIVHMDGQWELLETSQAQPLEVQTG